MGIISFEQSLTVWIDFVKILSYKRERRKGLDNEKK